MTPLTVAAAITALPWAFAGGTLVLTAFGAITTALLVSVGFGRVLTASRPSPRLVSAIAAGVLVALLSHLGMALVWVLSDIGQGQFAIGDVLALAFVSLLYYGWVTLPAGAIAGGIACSRRRKRLRAAGSVPQ